MRILLIVGWLFVGLAGVIFHYGPGQQHLEVDNLSRKLTQARMSVSEREWGEAVELFDAVLADLPGEMVDESRGITLEKAKSQMLSAQLPEARQTLETLLTEIRGDENADEKLKAEVQSALANAQYYVTWLMRVEGLSEEQWKPEIEAARQHYTQLVSAAQASGDKELLKRSTEDLESAIRLARMDISELQGLPLPNQ